MLQMVEWTPCHLFVSIDITRLNHTCAGSDIAHIPVYVTWALLYVLLYVLQDVNWGPQDAWSSKYLIPGSQGRACSFFVYLVWYLGFHNHSGFQSHFLGWFIPPFCLGICILFFLTQAFYPTFRFLYPICIPTSSVFVSSYMYLC